MMVDQQFNNLQEKLQQLLRQYARLKKENGQLRKALEEQRSAEAAKMEQLRSLEQQVAILKLAAGNMNEQEKKDFEKEISRYIREIDKCIAFLSA